MRIFISGKMTGEPNYNREKFHQAQKMLTDQGHAVMNPAILPDGFDYEDYMRICDVMLKCCDAIYCLKGWDKSTGATYERQEAMDNNMTIMEEI